MTSLNQAFEKLREILPNHHRDRPLSKMEALQLAQNYIKELSATLDFKQQDYQYYEACERSEQEYERSEEKPRIYSTYEQQQ